MKIESNSRMVQAHEKSVVLGGGRVIFPVDPSVTQAFARHIRHAIEQAELRAYEAGVQDARKAMRAAVGIFT